MNLAQQEKLQTLVNTSAILNPAERGEWLGLLDLMDERQLGELEKILTSNQQTQQTSNFAKATSDMAISRQQSVAPVPTQMPKLSHIMNLPKIGESSSAKATADLQSENRKQEIKPQPSVVSTLPQEKAKSGFLAKLKSILSEKELPASIKQESLGGPAPHQQVPPKASPLASILKARPAAPPKPLPAKPGALLEFFDAQKHKSQSINHKSEDNKPPAIPPSVPKVAVIFPKPIPAPVLPKVAPPLNVQPSKPLVELKPLAPSIPKPPVKMPTVPVLPKFPPPAEKPAEKPTVVNQTFNINVQAPPVAGDSPKVSYPNTTPGNISQANPALVEAIEKAIKQQSPAAPATQIRDLLAKKPEAAPKQFSGGASFAPTSEKAKQDNLASIKEHLLHNKAANQIQPDSPKPGKDVWPPLESLADLNSLNSKILLNRDFSFLLGKVKNLIAKCGYHEVVFNLEKSPLFKNYILTGQELLNKQGSFERLSAADFLTREQFERAVDLLTLVQVE